MYLFRIGVDNTHASCLAKLFIIINGFNYRIRPYGQVTRLLCPGQCRAVRAEISTEGAAPHTHVARLAFHAALFKMYGFGFGQMRPAGVYQVTVWIVFADLFADHFLYTIHFKWRQELAVGHSLDAIFIPTNADKFFHVRIPGRYIVIADRPGDTVAKFFRIGEFIPAPALAGPTPGMRFTANLVTAYPFIGLFLGGG